MAKSDVKVLGAWPSPYAMRPCIALNIKSVAYELQEENFAPKSELLLKSNPVHKKIPVLLHGDKPICESLIIVEYIDETWSSGPSILPRDPYDRAVARFWAAYIDEKWVPSFKTLATAQGEDEKNAILDQIKEGAVLLEDAFVKCSKGKDFFGGERIGYLDIALGSFLGWLRVSEKQHGKVLDEGRTPSLVKWAEKFCSDSSVKGVMPAVEKLEEFSKHVLAKLKAASG